MSGADPLRSMAAESRLECPEGETSGERRNGEGVSKADVIQGMPTLFLSLFTAVPELFFTKFFFQAALGHQPRVEKKEKKNKEKKNGEAKMAKNKIRDAMNS